MQEGGRVEGNKQREEKKMKQKVYDLDIGREKNEKKKEKNEKTNKKKHVHFIPSFVWRVRGVKRSRQDSGKRSKGSR